MKLSIGRILSVDPVGAGLVESLDSRDVYSFKFSDVVDFCGQDLDEFGLVAGQQVSFEVAPDKVADKVTIVPPVVRTKSVAKRFTHAFLSL